MCDATDSSNGSELQCRLLNELSMVKGAVMSQDGSYANITIPVMEDLHLCKFPPLEIAHKHLDFAWLHNSANMSIEQEVTFIRFVKFCQLLYIFLIVLVLVPGTSSVL